MESSGTFWSAVVIPDHPCKFVVPEDASLSFTNVSCQQDEENLVEGRIVVYVKVNQSPEVALMPFILGKFESTQISLFFKPNDNITLRTSGAKIPICVAGYLENSFGFDIDNGVEKQSLDINSEKDKKEE